MGSLWPVAQTESVPCARSMGAVPTLGTFKGAGRLSENIESSGEKKKKATDRIKSLHRIFFGLGSGACGSTIPRHVAASFTSILWFSSICYVSRYFKIPRFTIVILFRLATPLSSLFCLNNKGCTYMAVAMVVVVPARE